MTEAVAKHIKKLYQLEKKAICRFGDLSICQFVDLPIWRFANLSICQFVDLSMRRLKKE